MAQQPQKMKVEPAKARQGKLGPRVLLILVVALGDIVGKSLPSEEVAPAIQRTLDRYLEIRTEGERFIDTVRRVGPDPFRDAIYEALDAAAA